MQTPDLSYTVDARWTPVASCQFSGNLIMPKPSSTLLTKRIIDTIAPTERRYELWDSQVSGFGLRVGISGVKTFVIRYRADGGGRNAPRRYVTVGRYGALTVEQARKKAQQLLAAATVGEDPASERDAKRNEMRISGLIDLYEKEGCFIQRGIRQGEPMKERTKAYTIGRLRHHVVTLLGAKRVSEVQVGDVERFFCDVTSGKSASDTKLGKRRRIIVRGGDGAARKVFRDLSAVFSFAARRGLVATNPCEKAVVRKTARSSCVSLMAGVGAAIFASSSRSLNSSTRLWWN